MKTLAAAVMASLCPPFERHTPDGIRASFVFAPDFIGFDGHFPGNPVLPGIVQILAGILTAGQGAKPRLRELVKCKFLRPVRPGETMTVDARLKNGGRWSISITAEGEPCAQMTLELEAAEG